ncbi:YhgE/Pip domain-containing protein [Kitasatospora sp. NPDC054939]
MTSNRPGGVRARQVLRNPKVWILPTVIVGLVGFLLSLLYMGGIINPRADLHRLPIGLINSDQGAVVDGQQQNLGAQITAGVLAAPDPDEKVSWRVLDRAAADEQLGRGALTGALEVPAGFTAAVAALGDPAQQAPERPTMIVLTNPGVGSLASSLASSISQDTAERASAELGRTLTAQAAARVAPGGQETNAAALQLADPIAVVVQVGHPIGQNSGLGLTAFYYTLLLVLCGFLGANVISNGVDVALGYAASELGPLRTQRPLVRISRTATLTVTSVMSVAIAVLTSSLVMLATVVVLDMDASHLPMLWIFSVCATAAVGLGMQALLAAFGGIGQLIGMFVFIALSLPSSGATVPLEALPEFYQRLAVFEPMRQLTDGVRAILYFDAQADAGLARGWIMIAIGTVAALVFGYAMTIYYDRKGLHRVHPESD